MQTIQEQAKKIPVGGRYDVIVCGGGPAGIAAALAAVRNGATVLLIEAHGCLGGVWTTGSLSWIIDAAGKPGIMGEIVQRMDQQGIRQLQFSKNIKDKNFAYDPEGLKLLLEQMCLEAGIDILLHTRITAAQCDDRGRVSHVLTESKSGRQAWHAAIFIDATGDGDLSAYAGCKFDMGRPDNGETQPMTLMALLTGIDFGHVARFCMNSGMQEYGFRRVTKLLFDEMVRAGVEPSYALPTMIHIRDGLFALMANHQYGVSATDAAGITKATLRARTEVHRLVAGLKLLGGIWSDIQIISTAEQIGVREGRRIHGHYTVNVEDAISGARFDDAITRVTFGTDIHSTNPSHGKGAGNDGVSNQPYDIPLRSLIARDVDGLLLAGRCISGDFIAHASYRVTGNAVAMGQAAGTAAALSAKSGMLPQHLPWELLREKLDGLG